MQSVGIDVLTAEAFEGGDQVGAHALRSEMAVQIGGRIQRPGPAVAAHRHPRHRLDTANDHQIFETGTHFHRPQVHRFQSGGTESIDLHTGHADIPISDLSGGFGDIGALIADGRHAAQHHVIDLTGIEGRPLLQRREQPRHQVDRFDAVQGAIGLALASGRA
ncbi:hypothetical protein D3C87_1705100 [compost metagenome]